MDIETRLTRLERRIKLWQLVSVVALGVAAVAVVLFVRLEMPRILDDNGAFVLEDEQGARVELDTKGLTIESAGGYVLVSSEGMFVNAEPKSALVGASGVVLQEGEQYGQLRVNSVSVGSLENGFTADTSSHGATLRLRASSGSVSISAGDGEEVRLGKHEYEGVTLSHDAQRSWVTASRGHDGGGVDTASLEVGDETGPQVWVGKGEKTKSLRP